MKQSTLSSKRDGWSHDELLLAFNLYCKIPFSKTTSTNPAIIELARLIGRSASAVAMKLGNFGSFDPSLRARGISGLTRASKADRALWDEFNGDWERLATESELAMDRLGLPPDAVVSQHQENLKPILSYIAKQPSGPSETVRQAKVRLHQRFFRQTVLSAYGFKCCICDISVPQFLTAGHIIPWATRSDLRANPHNGLCLCSLHHDAFDTGFLTVDPKYHVRISKRMNRFLPNTLLEVAFYRFTDQAMTLPEKFQPDPTFLLFHSKELFLD